MCKIRQRMRSMHERTHCAYTDKACRQRDRDAAFSLSAAFPELCFLKLGAQSDILGIFESQRLNRERSEFLFCYFR